MEPVIVKAVAQVQPDEQAENPNGGFEVILSAPTKDRDGETLTPDGWEQPLPDHITFDIDHGMSVATTVGSGVPRIEDDGTLRVTGVYASTPLGQQTRALVNEGHIRTTSVAFLRKPADAKGKSKAQVRELLNGAFVAVPSNRESLVLASKGLDIIGKAGARNSAADLQAIQSVHDTAVGLGASCGKAAPAPAAPAAPEALPADGQDTAASAEEIAPQLDATLDQCEALLEGQDLTVLPDWAQQTLQLALSASALADDLLEALGLPDPMDSDNAPTARSLAAAAAQKAAAAAEPPDAERFLRVLANTYRT